MRRLLAAAGAALLIAGLAQDAGATTDCTSPSATSTCAAQKLLDTVRTQLSSSLADALATQQELTYTLADNQHAQNALHDQIAASEARLADLDAQIAQLQVEIDATTKKIELERAELVTLARTILTEPTSFLVLAARARDLGEVFTRTSDLIAAGARAKVLKEALQHDLETLQSDLERQQAARDAEVTVRDELIVKDQRLGEVAQTGQAIGQQLELAISRVQAELSAIGSQSPEIASQIQSELALATAGAVGAAQGDVWAQAQLWQELNLPPPPPHPVPVLSSQFRLAWPVAHPNITQGFGPSTLLIEPAYGQYLHFHTGIDLADRQGTPIMAAAGGEVSVSGSNPGGYGNYVIIVHSQGYSTLYGHLLASLVKAGDIVVQGQQIALMGSTGLSTGPHVHFELRLNGQPKDPSLFLPPLG
jgi:murein DD-endopeptidase MepM/ murein hydrolase activator NlpD